MNIISKANLIFNQEKFDEREPIVCPDCKSTEIILDEKRGEEICSVCGLIISEKMIDFGFEWRAYNKEEYDRRARTESNFSISLSNDLSTYIGFENRDALGQIINLEQQNQFFRLRKWQQRIKSHEYKGSNLFRANHELERLASQLDIPKYVKETSAQLYRLGFNKHAIRGYSIESMIAACIYAAARIRRVPRTLDEISQSSRIKKKFIAQSYRILVTRLGLRIPLAHPKDFLVRIGTELGLSGKTQRFAAEILDEAERKRLTIGRDPSGLAAASLYLAGVIRAEKKTQQIIAKVSHVTEVTIRHRHKEFIDTLESNYLKFMRFSN